MSHMMVLESCCFHGRKCSKEMS